MTVTTALALAAASLVAVAALAVLALHVLPTGYDPARDAVSDYGVGRFAWLYRLQVVASGTAALVLVASLVVSGVDRGVGLIWLVAYGVARIAIARYPVDLDPAAPTPAGRRHVLLAAVAFPAIGIAAPLVGPPIAARAAALGPAIWTLSLAVPVVTLAMLVVGNVAATRRWFGAAERLFYAGALAWLLLAALALASVP